MSSSESRINELHTIRRMSSVKEIMSKFTGSSVPETVEAFNVRVRKMSQSEKAMHRAMTKIADKNSNSPLRKEKSPIQKAGQAQILPSEWSNSDMTSILRHWSLAMKKEKPGYLFTSNDAKQALIAQQITEESVSPEQWKEWVNAIDNIVQNQHILVLTTSDSDISITDKSVDFDEYPQVDDNSSVKSASNSPARANSHASSFSELSGGIMMEGIAAEDETAETTPSTLSMAEKRNLFDRTSAIPDSSQPRPPLPLRGNKAPTTVSTSTTSTENLPVISEQNVNQLSPKKADLVPAEATPVSEPSTKETPNVVLFTPTASPSSKQSTKDVELYSESSAASMKVPTSTENKKTDISDKSSSMSPKEKKNKQKTEEDNNNHNSNSNPKDDGSILKAVTSKPKVVSSEINSSKKEPTKVSFPEATPVVNKPVTVNSKKREASSNNVSWSDSFGTVLFWLLIVTVPIATVLGVAAVLWPEMSQQSSISPLQATKIVSVTSPTVTISSSEFIKTEPNAISTLPMSSEKPSAGQQLNFDLVITEKYEQGAHVENGVSPTTSTNKQSPTLSTPLSSNNDRANAHTHSAVASAIPHWRRPFQNLLRGIKDKLDKFVQTIFPWTSNAHRKK